MPWRWSRSRSRARALSPLWRPPSPCSPRRAPRCSRHPRHRASRPLPPACSRIAPLSGRRRRRRDGRSTSEDAANESFSHSFLAVGSLCRHCAHVLVSDKHVVGKRRVNRVLGRRNAGFAPALADRDRLWTARKPSCRSTRSTPRLRHRTGRGRGRVHHVHGGRRTRGRQPAAML